MYKRQELDRALAAKPVGRVAYVIALVVGTIGLCTDTQHPTITDRDVYKRQDYDRDRTYRQIYLPAYRA